MTYQFGDTTGTFVKPDFLLSVDEKTGDFTVTHAKSGIIYTATAVQDVQNGKNFDVILQHLLSGYPDSSVVYLDPAGVKAINKIAHRNLNHRCRTKIWER